MSNRVLVYDLGLVPYERAWELQRQLQRELIDARSDDNAPPHIMLLVEHPHVFTIGKSGDRAHLLAREAQLRARNATFVPVDRGGDITYHGPGQLVAYPILDLQRITYTDGGRGTDIHRYLRELEGVVIDLCSDYGITAGRSEGRTGVWLPQDERGGERKVCAFGIRCSRWVTMHGLALNVNTDLSYFDLIVPCGIRDGGVTSLSREIGRDVALGEVASRFLEHFAERFGLEVERCEIPDSFENPVHDSAIRDAVSA